jgi:hypothetical protein
MWEEQFRGALEFSDSMKLFGIPMSVDSHLVSSMVQFQFEARPLTCDGIWGPFPL